MHLFRKFILTGALTLTLSLVKQYTVSAQVVYSDSLSTYTESPATQQYDFKWQQTLLPVCLIGAGAAALGSGPIKDSSHSIAEGVIGLRGEHGRMEFDDYIQYIPVAGSVLLGCAGVRAEHSLRDRAFITATSYAALSILVNIPKLCIDEKRPEFEGHNSFPSGHTATAFMGAELVRIEYGGWYGLGAYIIATGVGFMRMYNGRHYINDVIAGAGIGILSARIGEWSARLWQRILPAQKDFVLTPTVSPTNGGCYGVSLACRF